MTTNESFPQQLRDAIEELLMTATQKAKVLKAEADEAAHIQEVWSDLISFLDRNWPLHTLALVDKEASLLKKMRSENHPTISALEEIYRLAKEQTDTLRRRFPANLEQACIESKLPLDRESRHPRYSFEKGFFQLEIDEAKGIARLSNHEGRLDEFPADIGKVVEVIEREYKRVFDRPFEGDKFLKKLKHQYLAVIKKENLADGSSIPIRHITRRLGKNEAGFRTDEFLVDLSRLVERGPTEIEGRRLDLQQTKDTNQGMLLIGSASRGYIGFILFKEVA